MSRHDDVLTEAVRLHGEDELRAREIDPEPGIDDARRIARDLRATPEGRARTMRIGLVRGMWAGAFALLVAAAIIRTRPAPVSTVVSSGPTAGFVNSFPQPDRGELVVVADLPRGYEVRWLDSNAALKIVGSGAPFGSRADAVRRTENALRALSIAGFSEGSVFIVGRGAPLSVVSPLEVVLVAGPSDRLRAVRWRRELGFHPSETWRAIAEELIP